METLLPPPDRLKDMPLHDVTQEHGEAGLRQRFELEIKQFDESARFQLENALRLASELHREDWRASGEPYMNHVLRVATRIMSHYKVRNPEIIIAAVLHDTVEDHARELADQEEALPAAQVKERALEVIAVMFSPHVAELVAAVTNPEYDPKKDKNEQYAEHVTQSLEQNPEARIIKVSDFTDNGAGVHYAPEAKAKRVATKYLPLIPVLRDMIARPDTPLALEVKTHILGQLHAAEARMRAVLGT